MTTRSFSLVGGIIGLSVLLLVLALGCGSVDEAGVAIDDPGFFDPDGYDVPPEKFITDEEAEAEEAEVSNPDDSPAEAEKAERRKNFPYCRQVSLKHKDKKTYYFHLSSADFSKQLLKTGVRHR